MKNLLSTLVLTVVAGAAGAQADAEPPGFAQLNANSDGRIGMDEAQADAGVAERFQAADTDGDGYLSFEEFTGIWR